MRAMLPLVGVSLVALSIAHDLLARAIVDAGVAGALLAGGGAAEELLLALGFLLLRLGAFAVVPAAIAGAACAGAATVARRRSPRASAAGAGGPTRP